MWVGVSVVAVIPVVVVVVVPIRAPIIISRVFFCQPLIAALNASAAHVVDPAGQAFVVVAGRAQVARRPAAPIASTRTAGGAVRADRGEAFRADVPHLAAERIGLALHAGDGLTLGMLVARRMLGEGVTTAW